MIVQAVNMFRLNDQDHLDEKKRMYIPMPVGLITTYLHEDGNMEEM